MQFEIYSNINNQMKNLRDLVFIQEQGCTLAEEYEDDETKFLHLCGSVEGQIIVYARILIENITAFIDRVAILKEYRGCGYGNTIMDFAEKEATTRGCIKVELHAQTQASVFYSKRGYYAEGDEFLEDNKTAIFIINKNP